MEYPLIVLNDFAHNNSVELPEVVGHFLPRTEHERTEN